MPEHDDEDAASGPPPDPLDRVWLHPSELHAFLATPESRPRPPRWRRRAVLGLAVASAFAIAAGAVVLTDTLDSDPSTPLVSGVTGNPDTVDQAPSELVLAAGASIVTVQVSRADGATKASGVCIGDGVVLTSAHALEDATAVRVVAADDRPRPATTAGVDPQTDLALLEIDALGVPPAQLGSSAGLSEGEWVLGLAAGPKTNQHWVNVGAVNAFNRLWVTATGTVLAGLLDTQTGAGRQHAGGAVLDRAGAVVGIITVPKGAAPSGLAVPIDLALDVAHQLRTTGTAAHAWLGVVGSDETERVGGGARVENVVESSPAERAGLRGGDVIVAIADGGTTTVVSGMDELITEVRARGPGHSLKLTVVRDGAERHVPVVLGEQTGARGDTPGADADTDADSGATDPDAGADSDSTDPDAGGDSDPADPDAELPADSGTVPADAP